MKYKQLGSSGLEVSEIILGCMSFGEPGRGNHEWTLGEDQSRELIAAALDAGVTTFDTANVYSDGSSEEIVGRALGDFARREEVVIATKVHGRMRAGANGGGLSRGHILEQIDASLRRLGTDYIDLYQIHRWDPHVPIEETMQTLNDVVRSGKVRYLGASSMWAWQFALAQNTAAANGWTPFVSMQDHYNLISREEEREMHPYCAATGIGVIPWSPLARGRLARDEAATTVRSGTDVFGATLYGQAEQSDRAISDALTAVASRHGASRAQVALAWVAHRAVVTAPIVGVTRIGHLADAIASLTVQLSPEDNADLERHYAPRAPEGF